MKKWDLVYECPDPPMTYDFTQYMTQIGDWAKFFKWGLGQDCTQSPVYELSLYDERLYLGDWGPNVEPSP